MRYTIDDIERRIIPVAKSYGVGGVSLFGSYARGEADESSDVDILIDRGKLGSLIEYFSFVNELEDVLGCHVDVVTSGIEDENFLASISCESIKIYESHKTIIARMINYCDDICTLMEQYNGNFQRYISEISFQYACGMCLTQIGELAGRISDKAADEHPEIPWRAIKGMRNIHAHDYGSVDHAIVWETLKKDIPDLRRKLSEIVNVSG